MSVGNAMKNRRQLWHPLCPAVNSYLFRWHLAMNIIILLLGGKLFKFISMHSHPIYYFRYPIKQVSLRITFDRASGNLQLLFGKKIVKIY